MTRLVMATAAATAVVLAVAGNGLASAAETGHDGAGPALKARADSYDTSAGRTLTVRGTGHPRQ
jgi:hypothetical protein